MKRKKFIAATSPMYEALFGDVGKHDCIEERSAETTFHKDVSTVNGAPASTEQVVTVPIKDV